MPSEEGDRHYTEFRRCHRKSPDSHQDPRRPYVDSVFLTDKSRPETVEREACQQHPEHP